MFPFGTRCSLDERPLQARKNGDCPEVLRKAKSAEMLFVKLVSRSDDERDTSLRQTFLDAKKLNKKIYSNERSSEVSPKLSDFPFLFAPRI